MEGIQHFLNRTFGQGTNRLLMPTLLVFGIASFALITQKRLRSGKNDHAKKEKSAWDEFNELTPDDQQSSVNNRTRGEKNDGASKSSTRNNRTTTNGQDS